MVKIAERAAVMVIIVVRRFIIFPWILTKTVQLEVACTI